MKLKLINTIEVSPYHYANSEYELPQGSRKELPEKWDEFWCKCLADAHLANLQALQQGSFFVDITTITKEELKVIIKAILKDVDLEDYEEQIIAMDGGIAVKVGEKHMIEPSCCGDLSNIIGWENILLSNNGEWQQLWIGHPWVHYKRMNDEIEFSDYTEVELEKPIEIETRFRLPILALEEQLQIVKQQQLEFGKRIQVVLEEMRIQNANSISKLMIGDE